MSTKMNASDPDAVSTTVRDGTVYIVENGVIEVDNGEHIAELVQHGYTLGGGAAAAANEPSQGEKGQQASLAPESTPDPEATPEPEPELPALPENDPDFDKLNRKQIVEFLVTYGVTDRKDSEDKQVLVAVAVARLSELRAAVAETPAPTEGQ